MAHHHLTLFTYEYTSFQGWRLALCRKGKRFIRYFSLLEYGSYERARQEALRIRDAMLTELDAHPEHPERVFDAYRKEALPPYPEGFRPLPARAQQPLPRSCTVKCSPEAARLLRGLARRWQVDYPSLLRAALYMLTAWSHQSEHREITLQELAEALRAMAGPELPPFSRFAGLRSCRKGGAQEGS